MSGLGRRLRRSREGREAREREEEAAARSEAEAHELDRLRRLPLWTDSHCHLQMLKDPAAAVERARRSGARRLVVVGTDPDSSRQALEAARSLRVTAAPPVDIWATVGLHPHDASQGIDELRSLVSELAGSGLLGTKVVAIGECGLDFYYDHSPREVQRSVFAAQIALAHEHGLALVIHTRDAWQETFQVLKAEGVPKRTVFHCFTGGPAEAKACVELGTYLSFSGIVTFSNATDLREAASNTPAAHMLVETDSPFLTPVPHRGKPNEPGYVPLVGAVLAELKGMDVAELATVTTTNAAVAFGLHA